MESLSLKALTGGGSSGGAQFVGNVTNGSSFPTHRLDGSALQEGDYVRPSTSSTFPFVIGSVTFNSVRDKAIYSTAGWMIDPGVLQDTSETPVKNKTDESLSGNATTQRTINVENKTAIEGKVDKTNEAHKVYITNSSGEQATNSYSANALASTFAVRAGGGRLSVGEPTSDANATTKLYVDTQDNKKIDKIDTAISIEHAVVKRADGSYNLMQINSANNAPNAIVRRDNDKQINVPLAPLADDDAASKKYVDDNKTIIDSALSDTSTNPVQNKVIKSALDTESSTRQSADTTLQINIGSEATARANADATITNTLTTHTSNTSNPHNVTKAQVGLDQVDNTSDVNKPISTATQTALDAEALARTNADTTEATARETKDDDLQEQINNLSSMGRYLSTWNCVTGKPATEPTTPLPYAYKAGDYYIINGIGVTNYRPSGTQYTGTKVQPDALVMRVWKRLG